MTLTDSEVSDNTSAGNFGEGGGLYVRSGAVTVLGSTVSGNSTSGSRADGGGIFTDSGSLTLISSTVSGNATIGLEATGGGIGTRTGVLTLTNSTVTENTSTYLGGGVFVDDGTANPAITIENSIIAGNFQDVSAGTSGTPNDLVPDPDGVLTINHSLIGAADNLTQPIVGNVGNQFGAAANPVDPLLGPLADNGGPTLTHALLPGSPAIDAGSNALALDQGGSQFLNDQRGDGFDRIVSGTVDIGAFEFGTNTQGPAASSKAVVDDQNRLLSTAAVPTPLSGSQKIDAAFEDDDLLGDGLFF